MVAAIQPLISMGISKTVNIPEHATVEEIEQMILRAHELGLKAIAIYRDGCKSNQPITVSEVKTFVEIPKTNFPIRKRLPDERQALTHKFSVGGQEGYLTVGIYPEGEPGEIFVTIAKEGSTISGLMDALATMVSIALQYGVPLGTIVNKLAHTRFEPSGFTSNPNIHHAKSIVDYIARWLAHKFIGPESLKTDEPIEGPITKTGIHKLEKSAALKSDSPTCVKCGGLMTRTGSCYTCTECGETSGCS